MTPIVFSPESLDDLMAVLDWLAEHNPAAALAHTNLILHAIEGLKDYPQRGRPGRVRGTRELVVLETPYVVAYQLTSGRVEVLRVRHGRQRWPRKLP